jgi:hypothetical protein
MCYVGTPFAQDIFVTYSHGADASGKPFLQEWSVAFAQALETELRFERRFRNDLRLFLDHDYRPGQGVDPMAPLTDQLREQIGKAAILVVLMSPDYVASQWCKLEREWWHESQVSFGVANQPRIAVVRALPTPDDEWPDAFKDAAGQPLVGFAFHVDIGGAIRPLGSTDPAGAFGTEFKKALLSLVGHLYVALDKTRGWLEERRRAQQDAAKLAEDGGQAIYLHGRAEYQKKGSRCYRVSPSASCRTPSNSKESGNSVWSS